jgi:PH (Pleckstrin Homology) domain-containing protein
MTETFPIVPGQARTLWIALLIALILVGAGATLYLSLRGRSSARFEVSPAGLRLRGDLYGRLVPANALRLDAARAVDLRLETSLTPAVRTMGTALPGYRAGWFRLRDGEKALCYLTDNTRVAYVPTTAGYAVLVSVENPSLFLQSLRRLAGGAS